MRIVEHSVRRWESYPGADTETCLWEARVEHEGEYYEVQVEAREVGDDKMYYMGYIRNTQCIKAYFSDGWLAFGFSNIRGTCKYILKSMRKVIRGDYSSIRGAGHSVDMP